MKVATTTYGLPELDALDHDTLVLHHFVEDRPLRGLAGLVDWRMNGWLSRLIVRGWTSGLFCETLLMPSGPRLRVSRILLVGLGPKDQYSPERLRVAASHVIHALYKLRVQSFAWSAPGIEALKVGPRQVADIMLTSIDTGLVAKLQRQDDLDVCLAVPKPALQDVVDPVHSFEVKLSRRRE